MSATDRDSKHWCSECAHFAELDTLPDGAVCPHDTRVSGKSGRVVYGQECRNYTPDVEDEEDMKKTANKAPKNGRATSKSKKDGRSAKDNPKRNGKPAKDDPKKYIETERYTASLRCALTDEQLLDLGQQVARLNQTIQAKERDLKALNQHHKASIKEDEAERDRISTEIRDRAQYRPIDCERTRDYKVGTVTEIRLDTHATLSHRPMTHTESQRSLGLEEVDEKDESNGKKPEGKADEKAEKQAGDKKEGETNADGKQAEEKKVDDKKEGKEASESSKDGEEPKPEAEKKLETEADQQGADIKEENKAKRRARRQQKANLRLVKSDQPEEASP